MLDSPVDDPPPEFGTTRDGRLLRGVGVGAAEGPGASVATDQEIESPASRAAYLEGAWHDGKTLIRNEIHAEASAKDN